MIGTIINKLSSGAIERLIFLIVLTGAGLTGFAMYKGCDIDIDFRSGLKIKGCTGVMVALNTDNASPNDNVNGTMFASLETSDTTAAMAPMPPAAVMAPPLVAATTTYHALKSPEELFGNSPSSESTNIAELKPLSKLTKEGSAKHDASLQHIKQGKVSALMKERRLQSAHILLKEALSDTVFLSAEALVACDEHIDLSDLQQVIQTSLASGDICACTNPTGVYRIKRAGYQSNTSRSRNLKNCLASKATACIQHMCPSLSTIRQY